MVYKFQKVLNPNERPPRRDFVGVDQPSAREKVCTTLGLADRRTGDPKVVYTFFVPHTSLGLALEPRVSSGPWLADGGPNTRANSDPTTMKILPTTMWTLDGRSLGKSLMM